MNELITKQLAGLEVDPTKETPFEVQNPEFVQDKEYSDAPEGN